MEQNPYRSPTTDPSIGAPPRAELADGHRPYRPTHTPALVVTGLLGLQILAGAFTLYAALVQRPLLIRVAQDDEAARNEIAATATIEGAAALFELGTYIPCAIAFIVWLHRSLGNLWAFGAGSRRFTTASAIYWWFVPIANWFKPYQLVGEVLRGSKPDPAGAWRNRENGALLNTWWTGWVIVVIVGGIEGRLAARAETIEAFQTLNALSLFTSPVSIFTAILAMLVVREIDQRQTQTAAALGLSG